MKNFKKILGLITLVAIIAVAFAPQAQAKKKRDRKGQAIEDLLRQGNECYEAGNYEDAFDYFEAAHKLHEEMGCICMENPKMGIYFIMDPDGYWLEIVPTRDK